MSGWKPIETAPKDGTEILAWSDRYGTLVVFWYERKSAWLWTSHDLEGDEELNATHWMPLSSPTEVTE